MTTGLAKQPLLPYPPRIPEHLQRAARLQAASHATSADDLIDLLAVLGLTVQERS